MAMDRRVLHRDISRNNIMIKPDHQGAEINYKRKEGLVPYVPIKAILEGNAGCVCSY